MFFLTWGFSTTRGNAFHRLRHRFNVYRSIAVAGVGLYTIGLCLIYSHSRRRAESLAITSQACYADRRKRPRHTDTVVVLQLYTYIKLCERSFRDILRNIVTYMTVVFCVYNIYFVLLFFVSRERGS